jgi:Co/Zn/Cd efflux system component
VLVWAAGLLRSSARTLIDVGPGAALDGRIRAAVLRATDATVVDLHVWQTGPAALACHVSLVAHAPLEPDAVRNELLKIERMRHVTVEVNVCRDAH